MSLGSIDYLFILFIIPLAVQSYRVLYDLPALASVAQVSVTLPKT